MRPDFAMPLQFDILLALWFYSNTDSVEWYRANDRLGQQTECD